MEENFLYQQIAETIRQQIQLGELKPKDQLPPVRELALQWGCTPGTIQRAYTVLTRQGLVISRAGQGTHVVEKMPNQDRTPLRRVALIHRAEAFLLEVLTVGYSPNEVEEALQLALDRWRVVKEDTSSSLPTQALRFAGSHDVAMTWLSTHFNEIVPECRLELIFSGSLGGLIALAEAKADLAGCHLWDEETGTYNVSFVKRLLPGKRVALVTLAQRRLGLIVPAGNPAKIVDLKDLTRSELRFVNRQPGSGTRVWLDTRLQEIKVHPQEIQGYANEKMTHSEVSRTIAEGLADVGLGLEASSQTFGLGFIPLTREQYELAIPAPNMELPSIQAFITWLSSQEARKAFTVLSGYETTETGQVRWVE